MKAKSGSKRLWLVRHGEAVDAAGFPGFDSDRPLTGKGRSRSRQFFARLARRLPSPDIVITSEAVRAVQTADIFSRVFHVKKVVQTDRLNPGCRVAALRKVVFDAWKHEDFIALIGHEPDLSTAAATWIGARGHAVALKKSGIIELELNSDETLLLTMLLAPSVFDA